MSARVSQGCQTDLRAAPRLRRAPLHGPSLFARALPTPFFRSPSLFLLSLSRPSFFFRAPSLSLSAVRARNDRGRLWNLKHRLFGAFFASLSLRLSLLMSRSHRAAAAAAFLFYLVPPPRAALNSRSIFAGEIKEGVLIFSVSFFLPRRGREISRARGLITGADATPLTRPSARDNW